MKNDIIKFLSINGFENVKELAEVALNPKNYLIDSAGEFNGCSVYIIFSNNNASEEIQSKLLNSKGMSLRKLEIKKENEFHVISCLASSVKINYFYSTST